MVSTNPEEKSRGTSRLARRITVTAATGGFTFIVSGLTNQPPLWALLMSLLIGGITLLAQFLIDFEARENAVERQVKSLERAQTTLGDRIEWTIRREIAGINEATAVYAGLRESPFELASIAELIRLTAGAPYEHDSLSLRVAQAELDSAVNFVKALRLGGKVSAEGEARDWLLHLISQARYTLDATSRWSLGPTGDLLDEDYWDSELSERYLYDQGNAVRRGLRARRIFILGNDRVSDSPEFQRVRRAQQYAGIDLRTIDSSDPGLPAPLRTIGVAIFDKEVCYELFPVARLGGATDKPQFANTAFVADPIAVERRSQQFDALWEIATPVPDLRGADDQSSQ